MNHMCTRTIHTTTVDDLNMSWCIDCTYISWLLHTKIHKQLCLSHLISHTAWHVWFYKTINILVYPPNVYKPMSEHTLRQIYGTWCWILTFVFSFKSSCTFWRLPLMHARRRVYTWRQIFVVKLPISDSFDYIHDRVSYVHKSQLCSEGALHWSGLVPVFQLLIIACLDGLVDYSLSLKKCIICFGKVNPLLMIRAIS